MAENPKEFLSRVKQGLGESKLVSGLEQIEFQDANGNKATLLRGEGELIWFDVCGVQLSFTPGQAQRLINTLERWVKSGNFGKSVGS